MRRTNQIHKRSFFKLVMSNTTLYKSPLFDNIRRYFEDVASDQTIFIFVPYIKTSVLERLLEGLENRIVIITTWKPLDIIFGSSELELYPFCKEHEITLYVNNSLHLKMYSVGLDEAILATGNISNSGLLPNGNYEAATRISLTSSDRLFLENIRHKSRLIDDEIYEILKVWIEDNKIEPIDDISLESIIPESKKDDFLTSALPMTRNIDDLIYGYQRIRVGEEPSTDSEIRSCILHDLTNYQIIRGLNEEEFINMLTVKFFAHPFIRKIDEFIVPEAYFGRIKEWIQNNCNDVPVPSRRELTGNVQVLLEWFVRLGDGKYVIDVPGVRSQRIRKI